MTTAQTALRLFIPITKIDAAQRLVYGTLAEEVADKSAEIMDYATAKPEFEKWSAEIAKNSDGKSVGNVRAMHGNVAAGKLTTISFDDVGKKVEACAKIVDDAEWNKCVEGVYTGFSIGGKYLKRWKDGDLTRYTPELAEVSIVDNPAIPTATFSYLKADGTAEVRKFATLIAPAPAASIIEPNNSDVAARAEKLAKDAGKTATEWAPFVDQAREQLKAELTAAAAKATTAVNATVSGEPLADSAPVVVVEKTAGAVIPPEKRTNGDADGEQVWKSNRDGSTWPTKAALRTHHVQLDAAAAAGKVAGPISDALKTINASLDKTDPPAPVEGKDDAAGKSTISAPASATSGLAGYDLEGARKPKYDDAKTASLVATGRALKSGAWAIDSTSDVQAAAKAIGEAGKPMAAVKRHVLRAAKALKADASLPADWRSPGIGKADLSEGLGLKKGLYMVQDLIGLLASMEGVEESYEQSGWWGGYLPNKELTTRFGALLVEFGDMVAQILDECLGSMKAEEAGEAMTAGARLVDLMKVGARHSSKDLTRVQKVHDLAEELGAMCTKAAKVEAAGDLEKITAERDAMAKAITDLAPTLALLAKRVDAIERQPAPRPTFRTVTKTDDNRGEGDAPAGGTALDRATPEQLATAAIKLAQQQPIAITHRGMGRHVVDPAAPGA